MVQSADTIDRIYHYYKDMVAGKEGKPIRSGDITIGEWIGGFSPKMI